MQGCEECRGRGSMGKGDPDRLLPLAARRDNGPVKQDCCRRRRIPSLWIARLPESQKGRGMRRAVDIARKLELTALALGCLTRKELCAAFVRVNPNTIMTPQNCYNWQSGRSVPRSLDRKSTRLNSSH